MPPFGVPILKFVDCTKHTITLEWSLDGMSDNTPHDTPIFNLQIMDQFRQWDSQYCGPKNAYKVEGLVPEEIYKFRVGVTKNIENFTWSEVLTTATRDDFLRLFYLFKGVEWNKLDDIKSVLNERSRVVDAFDKFGDTALLKSVKFGKKECASLLLSYGADVNQGTQFTGRTPLMNACYSGQLDMAVLLVRKGPSGVLPTVGCTALHYTVDNSHLELTKYAIKCGANIDAQNMHGWTPIMRAVMLNASVCIIEELANSGANLNMRDKEGYTCFNLASNSGNSHLLDILSKYK